MSLWDLFDTVSWIVEDAIDDAKYAAGNVIDNAIDIAEDVVDRVGPIVEVGVDVITGRVLAEAAEEQANEDIDRLNEINSENKEIAKSGNDRMKSVGEEYKKSFERLIEQKKFVYEKNLRPFQQLMSKMVGDSRFNEMKESVIEVNLEMETLSNIDYSRNEYNGYKMLHVITGTVPIAVARSVLTSVKIEGEIDKAKEERERLKAEREKIYAKCNAIEEIIEFLNLSYDTVERLRMNVENQIDRVKKIVEYKGYDCSNFSSYDMGILKNCINIVVLLNQIVNTQVINEEGIINPIYKKYIQRQMSED